MLQGRVVSVKRAASTLEGQENTGEGQKGLNVPRPQLLLGSVRALPKKSFRFWCLE